MNGSKVYAGGEFTGVGDGSKATVHIGVYESTSSGPLAAATAHAAALRLIPNPARNSTTLTLPATSQRRRVQLLDALGRQVQTAVVPAQSVTVVLDLRGLPAGLYTVRCESASCRLMVE
ncbi:T9SS type A sorting domain-containing protein [Hymenobacter sp. 102]|uniref:T9SS type A sorting domain-containing protein n=1 Tax=Hymenobacter sp. 102 TaxID=3403152 RepID=UPI003CEFC6B1